MSDGLKSLVRELTDSGFWPWTRVLSYQDAANIFLRKLSEIGLIEHRKHPHGGNVYRVDGELFGSVDGIDESLFESSVGEER